MIGLLSIGLAGYEGLAYLTGLPTLTTLSRGPARTLIWAYWLALGIHFLLADLEKTEDTK